MNKYFADWHREVSIDFATIDLLARESVADKIAEEIDRNEVIILVTIAFGQPVMADDEAWFREPFKEAEPTFAMRGNDRELQLLASAILETVCHGENDLAVLAACAVEVAVHRGWVSVLQELCETAAQCLLDLGATRRIPPPQPKTVPPTIWTTTVEEAVELHLPASTTATASGTTEVLRALAESMEQAIKANLRSSVALAKWATTRSVLAAEETNLLWWLLSGRSESLDMMWSSVPPNLLAIAAGRELASMSAVVPAPPQAAAILEQLINVQPRSKSHIATDIGPLAIPPRLAFLIADLTTVNQQPIDLARHSIAQAMLIKVWESIE